jgi:hypothetical protein
MKWQEVAIEDCGQLLNGIGSVPWQTDYKERNNEQFAYETESRSVNGTSIFIINNM